MLTIHDAEAEVKRLEQAFGGLVQIGREVPWVGQAARRNLDGLRQGVVHIAVFGSYKRGKSTFINALLGKRLLPSGVVPTTALPTVIRYGIPERAEITFKDGRVTTAVLGELEHYVTEAGNPENRLKVASVEIFADHPRLQSGIRIVDTPGFGSAHVHNSAAAYEFLPNADAIVLILGADPPIGADEQTFLKEALPYAQKILFVQNKRDLLTPEELAEAIEYNHLIVSAVIEDPTVQIVPVSARRALTAKLAGHTDELEASNFRTVERCLDEVVASECQVWMLNSARRSVESLIHSVRSGIELERRALSLSETELDERIGHFKRAVEWLRQVCEEESAAISDHVHRQVVRRLDRDISTFWEEVRPRLGQKLENAARAKHRNGYALLLGLNAIIEESIKVEVGRWRTAEADEIENALNERLSEAAVEVSSIRSKIAELAADIFQVEFEPFAPELTLPDRSRFIYHEWQMKIGVGKVEELILKVSPADSVRRPLLLRAQQIAFEQIQMHTGRSRHDFMTRIDHRLAEFRTALDDTVVETAHVVEDLLLRALNRKRMQSEQSSPMVDRWKELEDALCRIEESLRRS